MASTDNDNLSSSLSSSLLLSDMTEVKKVFDRFDTNGDGKISSDELNNVLSALGSATSPDELHRMMDEMDADKDGYVSLQEFADFCGKKVDGDENGTKELRDAFEMYDQDKNGKISANELHLVLSRLGERCTIEDCAKMIRSVDADGDGNVSFEEFRKMMAHGTASRSSS